MLELMSGSCDSGHMSPSCRRTRRNEVTGEVYNPDEELDDNIPLYPKTDQQRNYIKQQLATIAVLRSLDPSVLNTIADAMMLLEVDKGTVVVTEGDTTTDKFYIIANGVFEGSVTKAGGVVEVTTTYENTGHFGGVSIFHYYPSSSTVRAVTKGELWVLDRLTYRKIVVNYASQQREIYKSFIEKVPFLTNLSSRQKLDLADAITSLNYTDGEVILKQGDPALGMYFIQYGSVLCTFPENKQLSPGDFFNEHAFSTSDPVTKSDFFSVGTTKLAFLELSSFYRLLGSYALETE